MRFMLKTVFLSLVLLLGTVVAYADAPASVLEVVGTLKNIEETQEGLVIFVEVDNKIASGLADRKCVFQHADETEVDWKTFLETYLDYVVVLDLYEVSGHIFWVRRIVDLAHN